MRATAEAGAIPPGFARPLTLGEVPLMACNDHNKPQDAPPTRTYRMLLPSSEHEARGYHALRFLRLRRTHLKQRWKKAVTLLCLACVGFILTFWSQLGVTVINLVQNLRLRHDLAVTDEDKSRCTGSLPVVYMHGIQVSWNGAERSQWLEEVWQSESVFARRHLDYEAYTMMMAFIEAITRSLAEENVEAALVAGSLVGSYLFHDFLPWGRAASFAVRADDKNKVKRILDKIKLSQAVGKNRAYYIPHLETLLSASRAKIQVTQNATGAKWRVKMKLSPSTGEATLPSLEIHIHWWTTDDAGEAGTSNSPVVILAADFTGGEREPLRLPAAEWQPFAKRPLGLLLLPAPSNPLLYITRRYHVSDPYCATRHFSLGGILSYFKGSCALVRSAYPHIRRQQINGQCVREAVVSNNEVKFAAYVAGRDPTAKDDVPLFAGWS